MSSPSPDTPTFLPHQHKVLGELLRLQRDPDGLLSNAIPDVNINGMLFGGQLIGQSLMAACRDLPADLIAHQMQLSFLLPGRPGAPMRYEVLSLMHGRNFSVQQVTGWQNDRRVIVATVSFHRGELGPTHQATMPRNVPDPETLPTMRDLILGDASGRVPSQVKGALQHASIVDLRPLDGLDFLLQHVETPSFRYWVRIRDTLPDDPQLHLAALGYMSDYWFPFTALSPHLDNKFTSGLFLASLNHGIWFHNAVRADQWLLVDARCPATGHGRGLTVGNIFTQDGTLVASLAQEGLQRGWVALGSDILPPGIKLAE